MQMKLTRNLRRAILPLVVFSAAAAAHVVWVGLFPEQAPAQNQWATVDAVARGFWWREYTETQSYWLGLSYALPLAFTAVAIRSYREDRRCSDRKLAIGGITLTGLVSFAILSYLGGHPEMLILCVALSGAVLGFLRYNWAPAKLFMGDAGSLFLGFALVFASIHVTQGEGSVVNPVVPLLILAVPITDTLTLIAKRLIIGRNPFSADTFHLHHMLIRFGLNKKQAVITILALCAVMSLAGILGTLFKVPGHFMFILFLVYFLIHSGLSFWADRRHVAARVFFSERRKHSPQSLKVKI